jgi:site-specific DNA-cytosine methylase
MIKFIDLFAGTGGIRLGFEQACEKFDLETECVFFSEIDKNACESYELNFGHNPFPDVTKVEELPPFDFMLAGFPCLFHMLENAEDLEKQEVLCFLRLKDYFQSTNQKVFYWKM